jgi:hypothetical protein
VIANLSMSLDGFVADPARSSSAAACTATRGWEGRPPGSGEQLKRLAVARPQRGEVAPVERDDDRGSESFGERDD